MTPEFTNQVTAGLLLLWVVTLISLSFLVSLAVTCALRRKKLASPELSDERTFPAQSSFVTHPFDPSCRWLAIRTGEVVAVQKALMLVDPKPCDWAEAGEHVREQRLYISPPVKGWILVIGHPLIDPADDVDRCYHFLRNLGKNFGHVQFFNCNRVVRHHAWVRLDGERIVRAYAWAGSTLWNQGSATTAELDLGLRCYGYGETAETLTSISSGDMAGLNTEKVPMLASRWSIDPNSLAEGAFTRARGVSGALRHPKLH